MKTLPAVGDEFRRVQIRSTAPDRDGDLVGQRTVADREVDAVMVVIDRAPGPLRLRWICSRPARASAG